MKIHDISRTLTSGIGVWPGDTPFSFEFVARIAEGSSVNVGRIKMSVHTGAHIDSPLHFEDGAPDAATVPLAPYYGPCVVTDARPSSRGILPKHINDDAVPAIKRAGRVLFRSYSKRPPTFDKHMAHATPELADWLASLGVTLLGVDSDSMDAFESKNLPAHHRLHHHRIAILEGVDLSSIEPGTYTLCALPLKIEGADGSPVRAVLIEAE